MRITPVITGVAVSSILSAFLVIPAPPAAAGDLVQPPADCTATVVNRYTTSLTCTNRPADQQWRGYRDCIGAWLDSGADGNIVTGNGTSTAVCPVRAQTETHMWFEAI
jgi:hypothetical protein